MPRFPRKVDGYECKTCGEMFEDEELAERCHDRGGNSTPADLWACSKCGRLYEENEDAFYCCG